jgi:hypothetical protein
MCGFKITSYWKTTFCTASKSVCPHYPRSAGKHFSRIPIFFYFATETKANCSVRLVLNDVRQTETAIHFKQNGRFVTFVIVTLILISTINK